MSWSRSELMRALPSVILMAVVASLLSGCASSAQKERRELRDKLVRTSKLYCEFLNGEEYPDIDVALNIQMAQRCDADKNFTITNYRTPSEIVGMMYCCSVPQPKAPATVRKAAPAPVAPPALARPRPQAPSAEATSAPAGASAPAASTEIRVEQNQTTIVAPDSDLE